MANVSPAKEALKSLAGSGSEFQPFSPQPVSILSGERAPGNQARVFFRGLVDIRRFSPHGPGLVAVFSESADEKDNADEKTEPSALSCDFAVLARNVATPEEFSEAERLAGLRGLVAEHAQTFELLKPLVDGGLEPTGKSATYIQL